MIEGLKHCFKEDFGVWLLNSNNPKVVNFVGETIYITEDSKYHSEFIDIVNESLQEILDILLREPLADYFWYGHPEHDGKLSYSPPNIGGTVPGDSLRVDKDKIKVFLRDIKIDSILL
jgi:hypothetical protein